MRIYLQILNLPKSLNDLRYLLKLTFSWAIAIYGTIKIQLLRLITDSCNIEICNHFTHQRILNLTKDQREVEATDFSEAVSVIEANFSFPWTLILIWLSWNFLTFFLVPIISETSILISAFVTFDGINIWRQRMISANYPCKLFMFKVTFVQTSAISVFPALVDIDIIILPPSRRLRPDKHSCCHSKHARKISKA